MIKIAIITRHKHASPRVLAESLVTFMPLLGAYSKIYYKINTIKRLLSYSVIRSQYSYHIWFLYKMIFLISDKLFIMKLKTYDTIIICDCIPISFYYNTYDIEKLRGLIGDVPVLFYAVFYLGNAPTQIEILKKNKQQLFKRYNWHLSVSEVTEIRGKPSPPWSQVGLYLKGIGLKPTCKKEFFAVVDFKRRGYEKIRNDQIQVLDELKIHYISLEKKYTIYEIRKIYARASVYFIQFPESFGVPIAECFAYGSYVFTPDSSWPMSWRLDENPTIHGPGILPDCFVVYNGIEDLKFKLKNIMENYDLIITPQKVFEVFYHNYPTYYEGNQNAWMDVLRRIEEKDLI